METLIEWKESVRLMLSWLILGLIGGMVHLCEEEKHLTIKRKLIELMLSCFTGMIGGMLFSKIITDQMVLNGMCAMFGYGGILVIRAILDAIIKKIKKTVGE